MMNVISSRQRGHHACEANLCKFENFVGGHQCVMLVDWRIRLANAGPCAPASETRDLLDAAPRCIETQGTNEDRANLAALLHASLREAS